jgi:hypothetical protein
VGAFTGVVSRKLPSFGLYRRRNPQIEALPSRKRTPDENKFQKVGVFFEHEIVTSNSPQITTLPPQIHHDLPPQKHPKSAKPPVKDHIDPV